MGLQLLIVELKRMVDMKLGCTWQDFAWLTLLTYNIPPLILKVSSDLPFR
jgi:hypothetical protein